MFTLRFIYCTLAERKHRRQREGDIEARPRKCMVIGTIYDSLPKSNSLSLDDDDIEKSRLAVGGVENGTLSHSQSDGWLKDSQQQTNKIIYLLPKIRSQVKATERRTMTGGRCFVVGGWVVSWTIQEEVWQIVFLT